MKSFIFTTVGLFAAFILLNLFFALFIVRPKVYNEYDAAFEEARAAAYSHILLGDSRAQTLLPEVLREHAVLPFAYKSDSLREMVLKYEYALQYVEPETVFLSADYHVLSQYRSSVDNRLLIAPYVSVERYIEIYSEEAWTYYDAKYVDRWLPLFDESNTRVIQVTLRQWLGIDAIEKVLGLYVSQENFDWATATAEERVDIAAGRIRYQKMDKGPSLKLKEELAGFVERLAREERTVYAIRYPLSAPYIQALENAEGVEAMNQEQFTDAAPQVEILDYTRAFLKAKWYRDPDHIHNEKKQRQLTERILTDSGL